MSHLGQKGQRKTNVSNTRTEIAKSDLIVGIIRQSFEIPSPYRQKREQIAEQNKFCVEKKSSLDTELSTSPMSTVLVVLDLVVSLHAEPWWDWAVLAGSLGQCDLCLEALLAWLFV